jgi:hypothetical protein
VRGNQRQFKPNRTRAAYDMRKKARVSSEALAVMEPASEFKSSKYLSQTI